MRFPRLPSYLQPQEGGGGGAEVVLPPKKKKKKAKGAEGNKKVKKRAAAAAEVSHDRTRMICHDCDRTRAPRRRRRFDG